MALGVGFIAVCISFVACMLLFYYLVKHKSLEIDEQKLDQKSSPGKSNLNEKLVEEDSRSTDTADSIDSDKCIKENDEVPLGMLIELKSDEDSKIESNN